jgi:hypothetical protein
MRIQSFVFVAGLVLVSVSGRAAAQVTAQDCDKYFANGLYDFESTGSESQVAESYASYLLQKLGEDRSDSHTLGILASLPLAEDVMAGIEFSKSDEGRRSFRQFLETYESQS